MAVQFHKGNMYLHPAWCAPRVQLRIEMHTVHTVSVVDVRISIIRPGDIPHTYVNHMCASMPRHAPHYTSAYTCIPTT